MLTLDQLVIALFLIFIVSLFYIACSWQTENYFILNSNIEKMTSNSDNVSTEETLNQYQNILDHSNNFDIMFKLGHYYFNKRDYDTMMHYYYPIIDAWMEYAKYEHKTYEKHHIKDLYNKVQRDIELSKKKRYCPYSCIDLFTFKQRPI